MPTNRLAPFLRDHPERLVLRDELEYVGEVPTGFVACQLPPHLQPPNVDFPQTRRDDCTRAENFTLWVGM